MFRLWETMSGSGEVIGHQVDYDLNAAVVGIYPRPLGTANDFWGACGMDRRPVRVSGKSQEIPCHDWRASGGT